MVNIRICHDKKTLYQWDTGVQLEVQGCECATEMHFATPDGLIKREVALDVCDVPDAALQHAGVLVLT